MEELSSYLEERKVKDLFRELMEQICLDKPDNVHEFVISFIQEKYGHLLQTSLVEYEEEEENEGEEEAEQEQDTITEIVEHQRFEAQGERRRRSAVSSESVNPNQLKNKTKKVVEKSEEDKKKIWERVQKNFLFSSLDKEAANDLIDAIFEKNFASGEVIMRQGDDGDYFYIIEEGEAHIFVNKDGNETKVMECKEGQSFGELALMYNAPRAATVKAVTALRCWAVDRQTFKLTLMESTLNKRGRYEKFLESVPILEGLYKYEKLTIADSLVARQYSNNEVVVKQGEEGKDFFIIEKGTVVFTQTNDKGEEVVVGRAKEGDYFGEISLLTHQPRAATAKCTSDCSLLCLDRKTFVRVMGPLDNILKRNFSKYQSWMEKKDETDTF
eukprot:c21588_g1_i1.p1 GENE.c21588_g1_i1~~c21588_g1_i1.p1  ORF type:complete len:385 (+),score=150.61 c21588_g1_i1:115-1269(+)